MRDYGLRVVVLVVAGLVAGAGDAAGLLKNGGFETGGTTPDGWRLQDAQGGWLRQGGYAEGACVRIVNETVGNGAWVSDPVGFKPGHCYRLTLRARGEDASGGTALYGTPFAHVDIGVPSGTWERYGHVFAVPFGKEWRDVPVRLGMWQMQGQVLFDDARLVPVEPVYALSEGLALGEGERLEAGRYHFVAPFRSEGRNHSRPLLGFSARFNTDRWCFDAGTVVTYRHTVTGYVMRTASVSVNSGYYASGRLVVEFSADGKTWQQGGALTNAGSLTVAVPEAMLPAAALSVRLRGAKPPCAVQVHGYRFDAEVEGPPRSFIGSTRYVETVSREPNPRVRVIGLGDALPGGENVAVLQVRHSGAGPLTNEARVVFAGKGQPVRPHPVPIILPGPGAYDVRIPYEAPSAGEWEMVVGLGEAFEARCAVTVPMLYDDSYGERLPVNVPLLSLWRAASGWKIPRHRPLPRAFAKSLALRLARNEGEAVQLVVTPHVTLTNLTVTVTDLVYGKNRIPASRVRVSRVGYVPVEQTSDAAGVRGLWPDPLLPQQGSLIAAAGQHHPFWIRVHAPDAIPAGIYRGTVTIQADGVKATTVLNAEVYDFTLPDTMTCETAFGFSASTVWRYHKATGPEQRRAVLDLYLRCLGEYRLSPYDPAPMDRWSVTWRGFDTRTGKPEPGKKIAEIEPVFHWEEWDAAMTRAFESNHFNTFRIKVEGLGCGTFHARTEPVFLGFAGGTPEYELLMGKYLRGIEAHLREKGWLDKAFVYWFDEPDPKDYDFVMNGMNTLKRHAPGLRRMLTEQIEPKLFGGPHIWCPLTPSLKKTGLAERREAGDHFWWYICCVPKAPYVTEFIDHAGPALRVWLWQTWAERVAGVLIWETTYWTSDTAYPESGKPQNPYTDPMSWTTGYGVPKGTKRPWGNGDGRLLYPPLAAADGNPAGPVMDAPVPSLRLEMLCDGIEDYEYFVILQRLLQQKGGSLDPRTRQNLEALLTVPAEVSAGLTDFTRDPAPIETHRDKLARAIVSLLRLR
ncbi:MAG TPA: DUF4091 domain-containing protein [Kiritimatiellia bacterium]|nr:DUF4091 domain-containing protein [Kiritimatiellia bacterium]HRU20070.1 DUF4091 domain-containing protein [Kiritimatiellia bacterium]